MPGYVAFLRAVNVGGRNAVPMAELARRCTALGWTGVRTFLASGNVYFEAPRAKETTLAARASAMIGAWRGFEVPVVVRRIDALAARVAAKPFARCKLAGGEKLYVAFLAGAPARQPKLPLVDPREGLEAFALLDQDLFLVARLVRGQSGSPNDLAERATGVAATTRNWNTVEKIVAASVPKR